MATTRFPIPPQRDGPTPEAVRILVVDDEPDILESVSEYLSKAIPGAMVVKADSGAVGLEAAVACAFNVALFDYRMPGLDGLHFWSKLQEIRPDTFGILMTADLKSDLDLQAAAAGIDAILHKPFETIDLDGLVARAATHGGHAT